MVRDKRGACERWKSCTAVWQCGEIWQCAPDPGPLSISIDMKYDIDTTAVVSIDRILMRILPISIPIPIPIRLSIGIDIDILLAIGFVPISIIILYVDRLASILL